MPHLEQVLVSAAALLLAGVLASKLSARLSIPSLLLFLGIGMLAGSDGLGGIWFDDAKLAGDIGAPALALILFAGGLGTEWKTASKVAWRAISLATIGTVLTAILVACFATITLGWEPLEGVLLGAIVSSTDAAAVFSVLRTQKLGLKHRLAPLLELESGSNDPMAVFLTLAATQLLLGASKTTLDLVLFFLQQLSLGLLGGLVGGWLAVRLLHRIRLDAEGLYPVLTLAIALLIFGGTSALGGSGYLAVFLAGLQIGNGSVIHGRSLARFHDALAWLAQISMFLMLGLLAFPTRLPAVAVPALLLSLFLLLVARPVSVFVSLAFARLGLREKLFVSWVGLRGAVPIILATFPLAAGIPRAELIFNLVFFVVVASVLVQGATIPLAARRLGVQSGSAPPQPRPFEFLPLARSRSEMIQVQVTNHSAAAGKTVLQAGLPKSALAILIVRDESYLIPRGDTVILPGDVVVLLADRDDVSEVHARLEAVTAGAS